VSDCVSGVLLTVSSTVVISGPNSYSLTASVPVSAAYIWVVPSFATFTFVSSATGYVTKTDTKSISGTTTSVDLCLNKVVIQIDVRYRKTDTTIAPSGASISWNGAASGSMRWTGVVNFAYGAFGTYNFVADPDNSQYTNGTLTINLTASTGLIIIYVDDAIICGDGICSSDFGETSDTCSKDCVAIFMEFENADGSGPVNGLRVNFYDSNPRTNNSDVGPVRNSVQLVNYRETGNASNTIYQNIFGYKNVVYVETVQTGFINFYWTADVTVIDPGLGVWRLRVHLSTTLTSANYLYRFVNTWRPTDAEPAPYAPTDLNLHLFHPAGPLDINNPVLLSAGLQIGKAVADAKQSGGPATMDISPSSGQMIAVWNSKPPRNAVLAPSQRGRYIVDSGSYVVSYGKTSDQASGKQLGEVVIVQTLDHVSDLWYVEQFTSSKPGQNQPSIVPQNELKASTIDASNNMFFDCEAYAYCKNFEVPYSDTGR